MKETLKMMADEMQGLIAEDPTGLLSRPINTWRLDLLKMAERCPDPESYRNPEEEADCGVLKMGVESYYGDAIKIEFRIRDDGEGSGYVDDLTLGSEELDKAITFLTYCRRRLGA